MLMPAGHHFYERQPDALLPAWLTSDADTEQEEHDYALSHHLLKDFDHADYFRDNHAFVMAWNAAWDRVPMFT